MSDRVSQVILLCEDDSQARLTRAYLRVCGFRTVPRELIASRLRHGGNVGLVLDEFSKQLHACRQRSKVKGKTILIVIVDADDFTVEQRRRQLLDRLQSAGQELLEDHEPVAILIPKRNIETWIGVLLGNPLNEDDDHKGRIRLAKKEFSAAAQTLFDWSRNNVTPPQHCVPSLRSAFREWRKIG